MFGDNDSKLQPLALDLGHDSVKLMQLQAVDGKLAVKLAARAALRNSGEQHLPAALEAARNLLRRQGLVGAPCIACLPRHIVHAKNLRMPVMPAAELPAAVQFEARTIFPFDTDTATVQFVCAGDVRHGADVRQEIIVFAARNDDVDQFVGELHRIGAAPVSLDIEPAALFRSIERFVRRREDEQEVCVLVDVGARRSQVIIGKGRDLSFFKAIDVGGQQLNSAVSRKLGITVDEARALRRRISSAPAPEDQGRRDAVRHAVLDATRSVIEELAREIALCLRYHSVTFRGHRPTKVRLLGGEAHDPQLRAVLDATLTVPVEAGRPLFSVDTSAMKPAEREGPGSEWATAFGMALRMTRGRFAPLDGKPRPSGTWPPPEETAPSTSETPSPVLSTSPVQATPLVQAPRAHVIDLHNLIPPPGDGPDERAPANPEAAEAVHA